MNNLSINDADITKLEAQIANIKIYVSIALLIILILTFLYFVVLKLRFRMDRLALLIIFT